MAFTIDFVDHVALRVSDMERSAAWYEEVLGLKRHQPPKWGSFPVFMLSKRSGVALFPARKDDPKLDKKSKNVKIDHFAFNLNNEQFSLAIAHFKELELDFNIQNHHYFKSVYTSDPDGHTVELTTLTVEESEFYPQQ
ncbi:VOC family protein [Robertkochia aurantiaca]|uniref:VOC family protein n=1 Tax=Robertkochia aurantiaca TaxID=2873700 RepID=UPI001CCBF029|nr:VOC family protein [Robertkochia sp. 3YJGBD-33]